ncbi:putative DNA binding domain-containing protein [bacterium]|nr:putative DNA binding domain-containing protein [bacterium]
MKETKFLEFKEAVSNTFLKTVSAFANYGSGVIMFGISDDGTVKGIAEPVKACLDIENRINDSLEPVPEYTLNVNEKTSVISLTVFEGIHKPYLFKSKAYRRNDTATVAADRLELTRLILEGQNLSYEELPAKKQDLSFAVLERKLKETLNLKALTSDTLKTLELYSDKDGYNIAAELLADANGFCGIDAVRFGADISILLDRETYASESLLKQYDLALNMYRRYYQYEQIKGSLRERVSLIPEDAFREAVANALVHRTWDLDSHIRIAMLEDRIEITSPGGLPPGVSAEEYCRGGVSRLRNRILGNVFYRLRLIERFGTGVRRICEAYRDSAAKPLFEAAENSVKVTLPVITQVNSLSEDENKVYAFLKGKTAASSVIAKAVGFGKSKTAAILKKLVSEGFIRPSGNGRGLKYSAPNASISH